MDVAPNKSTSLSSQSQSVSSGHRVFYDIPKEPGSAENYETNAANNIKNIDEQQQSSKITSETYYTVLFDYIEKNIIGRDQNFKTPFGFRPIVYCDYTASGRALKFIEEFIFNEVLPEYANTHTTNTVTSLQTTVFRHESRDIIRNICHASEHDAVLFAGSGCTGAVHKLIHNLNLIKSPIVVVGPFEHHSNLLPWRHLCHSIHRIKVSVADGTIDMEHLKEVLKEQSQLAIKDERPLLGVFAAVSNVSGTISDVNGISALIHRYHGIVFWDYATGAPYLPIDMNPIVNGPNRDYVYKDAVYFSMHKFVGGVQAPGVLIAKKSLFVAGEKQPDCVGGGTVFFVRRENQIYLKDVEEREEGGTPAIVGDIRAGLAFQLKEAAAKDEAIDKREDYLTKLAWAHFAKSPNLIILGGSRAHRLPIFSFVIQQKIDDNDGYLFLHHNFVCSLLNDLFGIQSRSGCACAGPYAMDLLGIDEKLAKRFEDVLVGNGLEQTLLTKYFEYPHREILRPGFVRINLPYFMPDNEVEYVLNAVKFVATHGYKFLTLYKFNPVTGEFRHRSHEIFRDRKWLSHVSYKRGYMTWRRPINSDPCNSLNFTDILKAAAEKVRMIEMNPIELADESVGFDENVTSLRWFLLPSEVAMILWRNSKVLYRAKSPFKPGAIVDAFYGSSDNSVNKIITSNIEPMNSEVVVQFKDDITKIVVFQNIANINENNNNDNGNVPSTVDDHESSTETQIEILKFIDEIDINPLGFIKQIQHSEIETHLDVTESEKYESSFTNGRKESCDICPIRRKSKSIEHNRQIKKLSKGFIVNEKNQQRLWKCPPRELFNPFRKAVEEFEMIKPGDRVLVCLSGGKDSLSMLHLIKQYQHCVRWKFEFFIGAATVDPGSTAYDPRPLIPYLAELGIPYFYEKQGIIDQALDLPYQCDSICSFCSRMKRGRLYAAARSNNYNVIALGQHLDDVCESLFMSLFHNGLLRTMKANYIVENGDIRVIRPLVYCREKHTRAFADKARLPVIPENCPGCFETPKERFRIKMVLAEQELIFPNLYTSLLSAIHPILCINRTGVSVKNILLDFYKKSNDEINKQKQTTNKEDEKQKQGDDRQ